MTQSRGIAAAALLVCLAAGRGTQTTAAHDTVEITYLGNEGFLVRAGSHAVLFDALFGEGLPDYDRVPQEVARRIERGGAPFAKIDVLCISHIHPDHFDLQSTARFMKTHPETAIVAPREAGQRLRNVLAGDAHEQSRIREIHAEATSIVFREEDDGVRIGVFPLAHGNVENWAYLVLLSGRALLHIGDADLPMNNLSAFKLSARKIDVAFVPFWQLTENPARVHDGIGARTIIPMHLITHPVSTGSKEYVEHYGGQSGVLAKIRSEFPNAVIFRAPLEAKAF